MFYPFTLAANTLVPINAQARFIRYDSGSAGGADDTIIIRATGGLEVLLRPGKAVNLPASVASFSVVNYANAGTITGVLQVEDAEIWDNRITGEVSVISGELSRTRAGVSFMGGGQSVASVGNYSHVQLFNPVGSGKNVIVTQLAVSAPGATGAVRLALGSVEAASFTNTWINKKSGSAAGVARICREQAASPLAGDIINYLNITDAFTYDLVEPVILTPGYGLVFYADTVNQAVRATFQGFEETV